MSSKHDESEAAGSRFDRRTLLSVLGAGAIVSLAGCTTQADSPSDTPTPTPGEAPAPTLDSQFGYVGRSLDETPPSEPAHEVRLEIRPRETAPIPEFYFEPTGLFVEPGEVVQFTLATPDHTITAYHPQLGRTQRVPDGVPAISSPVLGAGTYWLYRFDTAGVYDLYCAPHESFGMAMRVVVGETSGPGAEPVQGGEPAHGEPRPPFQTSATVLNDPALAPDAIVETESVSWNDLAPESKQLTM